MKKTFFLVIFLTSNIASDTFFYNTPNNYGAIGLINTPSARFYDSPSGSLSIYRGSPDRLASLTLYPYNWLEASIFYSSFKNLPYGSGITQDYKDKGVNLKFRIKEQDNFPALAVGFRDVGGTGFYSGEYIVSSYSFDIFDFHLGAGWGAFNEYNHLSNPFINIHKSFENRNSELGRGGKFNVRDFFSGENISIFGGINAALSNKYVLKIEYDPTLTPGKVAYEKRKSDFSVGINYLSKKFIWGLNYERGSNLSFSISFRDNFFVEDRKYLNNISYADDRFSNLRKILELNQIGTSKLQEDGKKIYLSLTQYAHDLDKLKKIVDKSIKDSKVVEEVLVSYKVAGLEVTKDNAPKNAQLIYKNNYQGFNQTLSVKFRPFIASREDFLKGAILLEHDAEYIFSENLFFSSNIKLSIIDNFDDLIIPPIDTYPNQVRSDIKKYLNNLGEKPSIGRAQLEYFKTIDENNHLLLSAGIYEEMFSGYGFEYLNFDPKRKINWGYEAHKVFKRDYDFGVGLLSYSNITHHFNFFFQNEVYVPFNFKVSFGEYLAGDMGTTIELSRSFKGGVEFGIFASFTDVTSEQFGEGSFDKGIFFKIPFGKSNQISSIVWRPLTKDPASKLIRKNNIYDLVKRYSIK